MEPVANELVLEPISCHNKGYGELVNTVSDIPPTREVGELWEILVLSSR